MFSELSRVAAAKPARPAPTMMTPVLGRGGDWEELRSGAWRDAWALNDVKRNGLVLGIEKEQWRGRAMVTVI